MTDLQCPARFLVCVVGEGMALDLRHERVAAIYAGTPDQVAPALAVEVGVPVSFLTHEVSVDAVLARDEAALEVLAELADLHRGETVVVTARGSTGRRIEVSVDGDGVLIRSVDRSWNAEG
jgi:hypothetical protein